MRLIGVFSLFLNIPAFARSIFEDKYGNGVSDTQLRQGNISFSEIPEIIVAITNNLLEFVGYISLLVMLIGALMYVFGGVSEESKSKGKEALKLALIGAIVSWSGWIIVNFVFDNF